MVSRDVMHKLECRDVGLMDDKTRRSYLYELRRKLRRLTSRVRRLEHELQQIPPALKTKRRGEQRKIERIYATRAAVLQAIARAVNSAG